MLPGGTRVTFDDRQGGCAAAAPGPLAGKPPVLGRWTIRGFAVLGILGIVYGTLAPFHIDPSRTWSWNLQWHSLVPGDAAANVLIYLPVGIFLRLLLRRRGSWWLTECMASLILAAGLSYLTEACQTVLTQRVPSWVDWSWNVFGATIGLVLAPMFQRLLRRQHAWLYHELRTRPFSAAAAAAIILTTAAALMPFDIQPTPAHVAVALARIQNTSLALPWTAADSPVTPLSAVQLFDKLAAAGCFGLVAFLMTLGQCESGRKRSSAIGFAASRSVALVAAVEMLQLFTIAHVADPRDLAVGWLFACMGAASGGAILARCSKGLPRPGAVLRGLLVVLAVGVVVRAAVAAACLEGRAAASMSSWLPMAAGFDRPWYSLLSHYLTNLAQYGLLASLLVLWSRAAGRKPGGLAVTLLVVLAALAGQVLATLATRSPDTAHLILALLAAWLVLRADRALFCRRTLACVPCPRSQTLGKADPVH
ncbi:MAG TPA: VanZ family protein [Phycisphaerae bacterium]|nr:VanZ family protein [Phycisphaerae bacterium]